MKLARSLLTLMTMWLALGAGVTMADDAPSSPDEGFVQLFDGRTFKGWEGNLEFFRIEDGAIVGGNLRERIPRNEFLCTKREYGDFELRLKCKTVGQGANAGVQFRTARIPDHHEVIGYQADMGQNWWGKLYDESRRRRVLAGPDDSEQASKAEKRLAARLAEALKPDDWNQYVIRCQGPRVQLWLNGLPTVDYLEPDESVARSGIIGLQIHSGPPTEAWYKEIWIRELKPAAGE